MKRKATDQVCAEKRRNTAKKYLFSIQAEGGVGLANDEANTEKGKPWQHRMCVINEITKDEVARRIGLKWLQPTCGMAL